MFVDSPSLDTFKRYIHRSGQLALAGPACARGLDQRASRDPFQPQKFYDNI